MTHSMQPIQTRHELQLQERRSERQVEERKLAKLEALLLLGKAHEQWLSLVRQRAS